VRTRKEGQTAGFALNGRPKEEKVKSSPLLPSLPPSLLPQPDYPNLARVIGRAYRYFPAERVEERIDPSPIAWKKVYIDSRKLLGVVKEVLAERMERQGWLCC